MTQTLILRAHPSPSRSVITRALHDTLASQAGVSVRDLYDLYPDFDIDVSAEQQALLQADLIIWLTPVHWYSVPALMKHWFDQVLSYGWAYGGEAQALRGKSAWWVSSAGAAQDYYRPEGAHGQPFANFARNIEHIATYCGMNSLPHWVIHGGHSVLSEQLSSACQSLKQTWQGHVDHIAANRRGIA